MPSIADLRKKMSEPHPAGYAAPRYDARTTREVFESVQIEPHGSIKRMARKLAKRGCSMQVRKDSDGAYRMHNRLDGIEKVSEAVKIFDGVNDVTQHMLHPKRRAA